MNCSFSFPAEPVQSFRIVHVRVTLPAHPALLVLITLRGFDIYQTVEVTKLHFTSLFHSPLVSSRSGTFLSDQLAVLRHPFPYKREILFYTRTKEREDYSLHLYFNLHFSVSEMGEVILS